MDQPMKVDENYEVVLESGRLIVGNGADQLIVALDEFSDVGLSGLARVWAASNRVKIKRGVVEALVIADGSELNRGPQEELLISLVLPEEFDRKHSPAGPISLILTADDRFAIRLWTIVEGRGSAEAVIQLLQPLLAARRARLLRVEVIEGSRETNFTLDIEYPTRGGTVGDAFEFGSLLSALIEALDGHDLTLETTWHLLRGGRAAVLVGQKESSWLEVKSAAYELDLIADKIELAQDIARFANSERGGLLIIGMRTKRKPDSETISALSPVSLSPTAPRRHHDVIDSRVFPPIDGLQIEAMPAKDGLSLLAILVPPQAEENKPFLVHGAIVNGRYEGGFISIVRRRGEQSIPISGPAIHSALAAGRALLRGHVI